MDTKLIIYCVLGLLISLPFIILLLKILLVIILNFLFYLSFIYKSIKYLLQYLLYGSKEIRPGDGYISMRCVINDDCKNTNDWKSFNNRLMVFKYDNDADYKYIMLYIPKYQHFSSKGVLWEQIIEEDVNYRIGVKKLLFYKPYLICLKNSTRNFMDNSYKLSLVEGQLDYVNPNQNLRLAHTIEFTITFVYDINSHVDFCYNLFDLKSLKSTYKASFSEMSLYVWERINLLIRMTLILISQLLRIPIATFETGYNLMRQIELTSFWSFCELIYDSSDDYIKGMQDAIDTKIAEVAKDSSNMLVGPMLSDLEVSLQLYKNLAYIEDEDKEYIKKYVQPIVQAYHNIPSFLKIEKCYVNDVSEIRPKLK